jgi:hypothetical protein
VVVTKVVEVLLYGTVVVELGAIVALVTAGGARTPGLESNASSGETQDVTSGRTAEKMFVEVPTAWKGGGSNSRATSRATSTVTETLASTSTRGPRLISSFDRSRVVLAYGA